MPSIETLTRQYVKLLRGVHGLRGSPGLSAAVYTQTTDVEYEGNGLLTYDREVVKMPIEMVVASTWPLTRDVARTGGWPTAR